MTDSAPHTVSSISASHSSQLPPSQLPQIQLIPLRAAIAQDQPSTMDVLVKIVPPPISLQPQRPALNLGLVIDRSGSMAGAKMDYAKQAACYAVEQLLPTDRVSVTIFDDRVETIVPSTLAGEKAGILQAIRRIQDRGSTALHAGWVEAGTQVSQYLNPKAINRVLLLSDGLANVGETNPDMIANHVHGLSQRGVGTTTLGLGNDYSEDLLEAMARSGDGNFYHIQSPQQLPEIFQAELMGLMATTGHRVSLGMEPQMQVAVVDVLNDLDKTYYGRLQLPNLVLGHSVGVVVRLKVPAFHSGDLCRFRLAWDSPTQPQRQVLHASLHLPSVPLAQLDGFPPNPEVQEQIALLMAARAREEAVQYLDRGDVAGASQSLRLACDQVVLQAPASPTLQAEVNRLQQLESELQRNQVLGRKRAIYEKHNLRRGR